MFRYTPPPATLFIRNREKFTRLMAPGAAAFFFANDSYTTNADGSYAFTQNSSFYYLTGIDQGNAALFLFPDAPKDTMKQVLFIQQTNEKLQLWEGWKYSEEEAKAASGIDEIRFINSLEDFFRTVIGHFSTLYLDFNEHDRNVLYTETAAHRMAHRMQREFPAHAIARSAPLIYKLRLKKEPEELVQLRQAIDITAEAFRRVVGFVQPGVYEYEIEAEILHTFIKRRATGPAYSSIIAGGKNACVLHYIINSEECKAGDVLLMDFGAEYGNYSADLTRSIPVNGRFTERQRQVYDAVARVLAGATALLTAGRPTQEYVTGAGELMQAELLALGLITQQEVNEGTEEKPAYKKYFPHGIGHQLGLDTHDVGSRYAILEEGMVLTCEPGIYIPEEGLGIRLENDILLTAKGPENLMAEIPVIAEEIEQLIQTAKTGRA